MNIVNSNRKKALILFLFVSGFCSLAYQVIWLREFRLLYGGATYAASAVLAVFMGSLGVGGWFLGKAADKSKKPGCFYVGIEAAIAIFVLVSPLILMFLSGLYLKSGGAQSLKAFTIPLQVIITLFVIGVPCFLMGGTLPTIMSYLENDSDTKRQSIAVMYASNIAGAVIGAYWMNFYGIAIFGNTLSLVGAGMLNLVLATVAYFMIGKNESARVIAPRVKLSTGNKNKRHIYGMSFLSGFVFFVIEIIWFRVSVPLLGGSVYNFGLILVIALIGMSLGGWIYAVLLKFIKPSVSLLLIVSSSLCLFLILPYAFGDSFAYFSIVLHSGYIELPFEEKLWTWFVIGGWLVLPTSLVAGIQFPLLVSLMGDREGSAGEDTGLVYGFNTLGAVIGSLIGGFILIPKLSIPSSWLFLLLLLVAGVIALWFYSWLNKLTTRNGSIITTLIVALTLFLAFSKESLTSYWQQNPIGFGRSNHSLKLKKLDIENRKRTHKRSILYQFDGRELSGALAVGQDLALLSNGKSDGSALGDSGTQIMLALTGAALHETGVETACVIGLGTGTSAGWLAEVESVKRVDVMELEPQLIECAKYYKDVNFDVVNHPKVNIVLGDAREALSCHTGVGYDLIASEPSNPQRAGVANLYTQEFYKSVKSKLNQGGVFTQWLQAYEIDVTNIRLILTTLKTVFTRVELYQTLGGDIVFIAQNDYKPWNVAGISEKIAKEPFQSAMRYCWGDSSIESFFAHYIASDEAATELAQNYPYINTDDLNLLELSLGKTGGKLVAANPISELLHYASEKNQVLPLVEGQLDSEKFKHALAAVNLKLHRAKQSYGQCDWVNIDAVFDLQKQLVELGRAAVIDGLEFEPSNDLERSIWAWRLCNMADPEALRYTNYFKKRFPVEYFSMRLRYYVSDKEGLDSSLLYGELIMLINALQTNGWCRLNELIRNIGLVEDQIQNDEISLSAQQYQDLHSLLKLPFSSHLANEARLNLRWKVAQKLTNEEKLKSILDFEPHFPLIEPMLKIREEVYRDLEHGNLNKSIEDLDFYNIYQ